MTKRHLDDSSNAHPVESHVASQAANDNSGDQHQRHDDTGTAHSTADKLQQEMPWYSRQTPEMKEMQAYQTALRAERIREAERTMLLLSPLFSAPFTEPYGATVGATIGKGIGAVVTNEISKH